MKKNSNIIEKIEAPGWDAIVATFEKIYPTQKEPLHYAPMLSWRLGGEDPLDGISVYDGGDYFHFVTFGFSELLCSNAFLASWWRRSIRWNKCI